MTPGHVRINELARELEIKCSVLLEYLPRLGVTEKKSHSGSIDAEHAELVRAHFRVLAQQSAASLKVSSPPCGIPH